MALVGEQDGLHGHPATPQARHHLLRLDHRGVRVVGPVDWWHNYRDGEMAWSTSLGYARPIRWGVRQALLRGASCASEKTAATCRMLLEGEEHLWTFLRVRGIEPTNNAAERALRHAVLWRKSSGGTASAWGSRFVERVLSVVATCRQQGRNRLEFLTECFRARQTGQCLPSLLADQASGCSLPSMTTLVVSGSP